VISTNYLIQKVATTCYCIICILLADITRNPKILYACHIITSVGYFEIYGNREGGMIQAYILFLTFFMFANIMCICTDIKIGVIIAVHSTALIYHIIRLYTFNRASEIAFPFLTGLVVILLFFMVDFSGLMLIRKLMDLCSKAIKTT